MSIRVTEVNRKVKFLAKRGTYSYWLGDDRYVYQFNGDRLVGYLCTADAWDRIFKRPNETLCDEPQFQDQDDACGCGHPECTGDPTAHKRLL